MRTTPEGSLHGIYHDCTKGELFWCALALYQLQKGEDAPEDGLKNFVKEEAKRWLN